MSTARGVAPAKAVLQLGNSISEDVFYCPACKCPVANSDYGIKRHLKVTHCNMIAVGINSEGNAISSDKHDHEMVYHRGRLISVNQQKQELRRGNLEEGSSRSRLVNYERFIANRSDF